MQIIETSIIQSELKIPPFKVRKEKRLRDSVFNPENSKKEAPVLSVIGPDGREILRIERKIPLDPPTSGNGL